MREPATGPPVELSAVIVLGALRERGAGALRSVLAQGLGERLEVILVDLAAHLSPVPGAEDPRVCVLPLPPETPFSAARAAAVRIARGAVVAFLEEHVRAAPGWGETVLGAFASGPWAGVGTAILNANPGVGASDIAWLLAYGHWIPPLAGGETEMLPGHNCCYRRDRLLALGAELEPLLRSDLVLQARLRAAGERLWIEPAAALAHLNETTFRSRARGVFHWYRLFAVQRAAAEGWRAGRRLLYVTAAPLLPFYFLAHFSRSLARERPERLPLLWRHVLYVVGSFWVAGIAQALGLLFGAGKAEARFTHFELTEPRPAR